MSSLKTIFSLYDVSHYTTTAAAAAAAAAINAFDKLHIIYIAK